MKERERNSDVTTGPCVKEARECAPERTDRWKIQRAKNSERANAKCATTPTLCTDDFITRLYKKIQFTFLLLDFVF